MKNLIVSTVALAVLAALIVFFFLFPKNQTPNPLPPAQINQNSTTSNPVAVTQAGENTRPGMKRYRSEQWGFEFLYPEGWEWKENIFRSPNSKFNLTLMKVDGQYTNQDTIINIVTPKFAEHIALTSHDTFKVEKIFIEGIESTKYSSVPGGPPEFIVDVPIDQYHILFGSAPWDEDKINQILSSFKFLK